VIRMDLSAFQKRLAVRRQPHRVEAVIDKHRVTGDGRGQRRQQEGGNVADLSRERKWKTGGCLMIHKV